MSPQTQKMMQIRETYLALLVDVWVVNLGFKRNLQKEPNHTPTSIKKYRY
jgi:hypothetical protein